MEKDDRRNRPDHVARGELSMFWRRLRSRERDLERELRSDLELEAAERQENGLPAEEAHYAARRAFGNTTYGRKRRYVQCGDGLGASG